MFSAKEDTFWNVLLRGEVRARAIKFFTLDDTIDTLDLAISEAQFVDHTGNWLAINEPAISLPVKSETALKNTSIVRVRKIEPSNWEAALESTVMVRSVVCVEAVSAGDAMMAASMALPPTHWQIDGVDAVPGGEVFVGSADVFESVYASSCSASLPN